MVTDMAIDKDLEKRNNQKDHFNYIAEDYINIRNSNKSHLYYKKILWEYFFSIPPVCYGCCSLFLHIECHPI